MLEIAFQLRIPYSELELTYARSSGPGGQNVNKVNTKAVLRWNVMASPSLSDDLRTRILFNLSSKITRSGDVLVSSDRYRDQLRNREDCYEKFRDLIRAAIRIEKPRKETKATYSSKKRRINEKKLLSSKKQSRGKGGFDRD